MFRDAGALSLRTLAVLCGRKRRNYQMKWILSAALTATLSLVPNGFAQTTTTPPPTTEAQDTNIRAYIELLRANVRAEKTAIVGQIMDLNDDQAAKFWPIYREYDAALQQLNDKKLAGIKEYAKNYDSMTDEKADELAKLALDLENQRNDLKRTYYEKVSKQLGGILAARFLQIENQLLMVIDLQIASSLPIVSSSSESK
jgi:hypothetical protein